MHIVFYAKLGEEKGDFDIESVIRSICKKLIDRHPHIYGDTIVNNEEDVKKNWEQLKLKEGRTSILGGVPKGLPALVKAYRIQEKVKQVGFEWEYKEQVWDKVQEEMKELQEAMAKNDRENMEEEFGDLLFTMVNYARFLEVEPEAALERCNIKFIRRFKYMEEQSKILQKDLKEMSLDEMESLWQEAKHKA